MEGEEVGAGPIGSVAFSFGGLYSPWSFDLSHCTGIPDLLGLLKPVSGMEFEGLEVGAGLVGGFEGSGSERPFAFIVASVYLVPCMTVELSLLYFGW